MITKDKLDRQTKPKNKVVVRITLPDAKTYEACADTIHELAAQSGATVAVKMV